MDFGWRDVLGEIVEGKLALLVEGVERRAKCQRVIAFGNRPLHVAHVCWAENGTSIKSKLVAYANFVNRFIEI